MSTKRIMKAVCGNGELRNDHVSPGTPKDNSGSALRRTIVIGIKNLEVSLISTFVIDSYEKQ